MNNPYFVILSFFAKFNLMEKTIYYVYSFMTNPQESKVIKEYCSYFGKLVDALRFSEELKNYKSLNKKISIVYEIVISKGVILTVINDQDQFVEFMKKDYPNFRFLQCLDGVTISKILHRNFD